MPAAKIRLFPDAVLRQSAQKVRVFDQNLAKTVEILIETMEAQPSGIGIAAPQIGISRQIAIVDVSARVKGAKKLVLINPEVLETAEPKLSREGCMSLPEYTANLKRYDWVKIRWQNEWGEVCEKEASGIEAVCIQHEIDHLNGMMFIDRVASLKTDMMPRFGR